MSQPELMPCASVRINIPLRLGRGQNDRETTFERARRIEREREAVGKAILVTPGAKKALREIGDGSVPVHLSLIRVTSSRGRLLDKHENLPASCKAVVDEFCKWMGVDDGDERVRITYGQDRGIWGVIATVTQEPERVVEKPARVTLPPGARRTLRSLATPAVYRPRGKP